MKEIIEFISKDLAKSLLAIISGCVVGAVSLNYYQKCKNPLILMVPGVTTVIGTIMFPPAIASLYSDSIVIMNGLIPLANKYYFEKTKEIRF